MISEENGSISIAHQGKLEHDLDLTTFQKRLLTHLELEENTQNEEIPENNS